MSELKTRTFLCLYPGSFLVHILGLTFLRSQLGIFVVLGLQGTEISLAVRKVVFHIYQIVGSNVALLVFQWGEFLIRKRVHAEGGVLNRTYLVNGPFFKEANFFVY